MFKVFAGTTGGRGANAAPGTPARQRFLGNLRNAIQNRRTIGRVATAGRRINL